MSQISLCMLLIWYFPMLFFLRGKALGTKRLASEELVNDWDNKRLNAGHVRFLDSPWGLL